MQLNRLGGPGYLLQGVRLLTKPGIRLYVLIPLAINLLLFSALIVFAFQQVEQWMMLVSGWLPDWLGFVDWLLWAVFAVLVVLLVVFTFNVLANLVAAPFNGFLAEAVEVYLTGNKPDLPQRTLLGEVRAGLSRELVKLRYYLPRALALLLLSMIPLLNMAAPILWFLFGAWMMAIQYLDYPMDNNGVDFQQMRRRLGQQRLICLGYGAAVLMVAIVPLVNLIVMPAAVAGATACWVQRFRESPVAGIDPR